MFSLAILKSASRATTPLLARSLLARPLVRSGYATTNININIDPSHLESYPKDVAKELGEETNTDPDVLEEEEEDDVLNPPPQEVLKHHGTVVEAPCPEIEVNVVIRPGEKWDERVATESEADVKADQFPVKDVEELQKLTIEEELAEEKRKHHEKV
ncbi:hypothetical protein BDY24DRAFT_163416 [Mrakia frigida]|uniref:uncharacterized protein n=1 Tax=Mrakia frigida TaxID=29902 RepID=UPI003FCC1834